MLYLITFSILLLASSAATTAQPNCAGEVCVYDADCDAVSAGHDGWTYKCETDQDSGCDNCMPYKDTTTPTTTIGCLGEVCSNTADCDVVSAGHDGWTYKCEMDQDSGCYNCMPHKDTTTVQPTTTIGCSGEVCAVNTDCDVVSEGHNGWTYTCEMDQHSGCYNCMPHKDTTTTTGGDTTRIDTTIKDTTTTATATYTTTAADTTRADTTTTDSSMTTDDESYCDSNMVQSNVRSWISPHSDIGEFELCQFCLCEKIGQRVCNKIFRFDKWDDTFLEDAFNAICFLDDGSGTQCEWDNIRVKDADQITECGCSAFYCSTATCSTTTECKPDYTCSGGICEGSNSSEANSFGIMVGIGVVMAIFFWM